MMAFVKALLAALGACAAAAPLRAPTDKPNVVLIYADDLGFGDPGFNGHPTNDSPHIDGLRARGKRITTWYSGCPVCTGSRASLMTGRVFSRVGVPGVFGGTSQTGLPLSEVTLADQFKKAGYATGAVGKWHLGQREMYLPAARGFDEYLGIPFSDDMGAGRYSPCGIVRTLPRGLLQQAWLLLRHYLSFLISETPVESYRPPQTVQKEASR